MATVAISALPAAVTVNGTDIIPGVQGGATKKYALSLVFSIPPAIGGTTPNSGAFTTLAATTATATTVNATTVNAFNVVSSSTLNITSTGDITVTTASGLVTIPLANLIVGVGVFAQSFILTGGGAPTWTQGSGVPASTQPKGSLYSRTGGGVGSTLYVSQGAGTWNAVAAV